MNRNFIVFKRRRHEQVTATPAGAQTGGDQSFGYKPRSHDLSSLEKRAANEIEEFEEVFPKETEEQRELFELLCRAYIEARYHKRFQVTTDQLRWLEKPVLQLKQITHDLCQQAGVVTELLETAPPEEPTEEFMAELEKSWEDSGRKELALKTIRRYINSQVLLFPSIPESKCRLNLLHLLSLSISREVMKTHLPRLHILL